MHCPPDEQILVSSCGYTEGSHTISPMGHTATTNLGQGTGMMWGSTINRHVGYWGVMNMSELPPMQQGFSHALQT